MAPSSPIRYFDYAATAPLCEEAAEAMKPYLLWGVEGLSHNGNANSLHTPGRNAFSAMESARRVVAKAIGARRPDEVIFTSGATESDDAALIGLAQAQIEARRNAGKHVTQPRIIVSQIEHSAVLNPAKKLESMGFEVIRLGVDSNGFVNPEAFEAALTDQTLVASILLANSEVGSIQPIQKLASIAHKKGCMFHTDATQALGKIPVNVMELGVDAASFSAHKIGGPKGIGALYLKARTPFEPYLLGGGQESGKRSGTQNVCGMAGFAAACKAACGNVSAEQKRLISYRDKLYEQLSSLRGVRATVAVDPGSTDYLPNLVHVMVKGVESETMIVRFDSMGICVSGGSACSSHSLDPSRVLTSMGIQADWARGALRLSMGRYTTEEDIQVLLEAIPKIISWK